MIAALRRRFGFNPYKRGQSSAALIGKAARLVRSEADLLTYRLGRSVPRCGGIDFLCIGAQKSGTTWLHAVLSTIDGIALGPEKELHQFNQGCQGTLSHYARLFGENVGFRGEITPAYCTLPDWKVKLIHRLWPDLRVFLIARNPIERSWSAAKMDLGLVGGESLDDVPVEEYVRYFESRRCRARSNYVDICLRWASVFGPERFRVFFYDDLQADPQQFANDIIRFALPVADADTVSSQPVVSQTVFSGASVALPDGVKASLRRIEEPGVRVFLTNRGRPELIESWLAAAE